VQQKCSSKRLVVSDAAIFVNLQCYCVIDLLISSCSKKLSCVYKQACFMRGLNAVNVTEDDLQRYLRDWVQISASISGNVECRL